MPVPATPPQRRSHAPRPVSAAAQAALVAAAAAAGAAAVAAAPGAAGPWAAATVCAAWLCLAAAVVAGAGAVNRARRAAAASEAELRTLRARAARAAAESAQLADTALPALAARLRDGEPAARVLASLPPPQDPRLHRLLRLLAQELEDAARRTRQAADDGGRAVRQLALAADGVDRLTAVTLPAAVARLRDGSSADTVLGRLELPPDGRLRVLAEATVRELALGERRAAAAREAGARALSRVQAAVVSMLADLREMQDRHGEEVFGDLLRLDHSTSQLGLLTDRLALLMGGRASRAWNRPLPLESVLRGAAGRIAAYRRVRLHSSGTACVAGFAAEGVMHLLAELMDNAANFSPPVDEVHVYVEERTAGLVVTIEDSGLKMADAAMRRAEEAVSGRSDDLARLQGTRLGLTVVGRIASRYGLSVSFRPSSRGGTGVVVLFPPQVLSRPGGAGTGEPAPGTDVLTPEPSAPTAAGSGSGSAPARPAERAPLPAGATAAPGAGTSRAVPGPPPPAADRRVATPGGLPVRPPGRTMAAADRGRHDPGQSPPRAREAGDAGARFGAFAEGLARARPPGSPEGEARAGRGSADGAHRPQPRTADPGNTAPDPGAARAVPEPRTPGHPPAGAS
ncbi:ATP-binding protein [Streptomyces sp. C10-9-1]|uniref:ATP-binding protein n=1 Tax=Streptomyces sp. C10-9-1 TaxID=1859285 RepID=UPI0021110086|nr:ATP-binding protein [Streptomyces sp. C10-9-1]MCQ6555049.1 ATP-binding protein [Streptomyces sp. C10-9-1]